MTKPRILTAGMSDIGRLRHDNEDSYFIGKEEQLFVLADGMGGTDFGKAASEIAVELIPKYFLSEINSVGSNNDILPVMEHSLQHADIKINEYKNKQGFPATSGTTADVLYINDETYYTAHAGDSRINLLREDNLTCLTKDHTLLQKMIDSGEAEKPASLRGAGSNILTNCLGCKEHFYTDTSSGDLQPGDLFLLCSDGLYGYVEEENIRRLVSAEEELPERCKNLIDAANAAGGGDNITVIIVQIIS